MKKLIKSPESESHTKTNAIVHSTRVVIRQVYTENVTETQLDTQKKASLHASDLFSLFTADIIKEDVIFTR